MAVVGDLIRARRVEERTVNFNFFPPCRMLPAVQARIAMAAERLKPKLSLVRDFAPTKDEPPPEPPQITPPFYSEAWAILECRPITVIQRLICKHYSLQRDDLLGPRRHASLVLPRMIAIYLSCKHTKLSLPDIGRWFGGRDHTTIMHSRNRITALIKTNPEIAALVEQFSEALPMKDDA